MGLRGYLPDNHPGNRCENSRQLPHWSEEHRVGPERKKYKRRQASLPELVKSVHQELRCEGFLDSLNPCSHSLQHAHGLIDAPEVCYLLQPLAAKGPSKIQLCWYHIVQRQLQAQKDMTEIRSRPLKSRGTCLDRLQLLRHAHSLEGQQSHLHLVGQNLAEKALCTESWLCVASQKCSQRYQRATAKSLLLHAEVERTLLAVKDVDPQVRAQDLIHSEARHVHLTGRSSKLTSIAAAGGANTRRAKHAFGRAMLLEGGPRSVASWVCAACRCR
mmetsp:Transcript_72831/g.129318  ORF Transcript_72831/g.129318 Transcript_72831/m.129318 type:complete len:273 (+) Transcript_72831:558-1376(+)